MPRFSANLSMLFGEHDFLDRFDAAARAGFKAVEYVGPYDHAPEVVAARLKKNGLEQALFNLPAGNWAAGERGIAVLPDRIAEFRKSVETAITYAKALGCAQVNCLAGIAPAGVASAELEKIFVENLKFAADRLEKAGIKLLIEAINTRDIPGFFLHTSKQALRIIERVSSKNLYFQYDIYHMQVMEGDLARTIEANLDRIAHIQIADNPGRHEPGTGEINYPFLYDHLDRIGYSGWVGAEYKPKAGTEAGLGWFKALAGKGSAAA
ncbi:MAG: hydroxypyruvate isomerase [Alphaproteobacteria bacterium]|nr:hydroxypyruvate isomerase [Alphaproteobacteria bacterium]MBU0806072.1 hydroxypyruvate isomerase [Alphaproteobacteria bacterium]MBU0871230.1 hydroxypyruvate isomerase [Alphaproteobacteria bacterium]MBU1400380.1 hydroxypyruvate isomerase [Alphaproteobacteria bacterium]MBU1591597.1 hydroxypyruvate isomerase [Alphaproteobacteria bacterium]